MRIAQIQAAAWLAFALSARAGAALTGECSIEFTGHSTLHDFRGTVHSQPFEVAVAQAENGEETWSVDVNVTADQMNTGNGARDRKMRALLKVVEFPIIRGAVARAAPAAFRNAAGPSKLPLKLSLLARDSQVEADVSNWQEDEKRVEFDMAFPVSLGQYGVKPPSMMGMMKVSDRVDVLAHVVLKKE